MWHAIVAAFSMYSRIPMPRMEWNERNTRYQLCCFPLVGAVIGLCSYGLFLALDRLGAGVLLKSAALAALPLLLSGGIHMDGFLDAVDAIHSYRPKEERLRILKDPQIGAFAFLYGFLYLVLCMGCFGELSRGQMSGVALGYVYSRILSGLSVASFPQARKEGMAAQAAASSGVASGKVRNILLAQLIACILAFGWLQRLYGLLAAAAGLVCLFSYRRMAIRLFGGVTGDLAGYFLQVCELCILAVFTIARWLPV